MKILKTYKYRIYPNSIQKEQISKTFGCARFVYNSVLSYRKEKYEKENISINKIECNKYCNQILKNKYLFLKEVDKFALTNSIYNMDNAYQKFFKEHRGYPKFKSKKNNYKSYTTNYTNNNIEVDFINNKIKLPKLKYIKAKVHRKFNGIIKGATIIQVPSGKYYVSILVEEEQAIKERKNNVVGIDLGIKELCVLSNGKKYENIKVLKKYESKIKRIQKKLSKKIRGSHNYYKMKHRLALVHEKVANIRQNYLHKISSEIVCENQVIITENLNVKSMIKNHRLAASIIDVSFYELTRQLEYKAKWNDRIYEKVDTFYPSSQICNVCGEQNKKVKDLQIREWVCNQCNTKHDRDYNASINILKQGLLQLI